MENKFFITTAIAYTSKKPHIGNVYEAVLTDAIARYKRGMGYDVHFLTGTDEHGQKIEDSAKEVGISPKQYVDNIAGEIKDIWNLMNTSYDYFVRTTDEQHERVVQKIFKKLYEKGDIYKGKYEGLYCVPCESFFTETQLVDGCCPDCGATVKKTTEEAYFLKLSNYQDRLMKHIEENPNFIVPESRKREMINNFLKPGLQDLCVSRTSFKWGVPVDFDDNHVVYVWIDALSNYITAIGYAPDGSTEQFNKFWPADVHVIGKDILRFHTIYWPIMLMALDLELPKQIFGHPWLLFGKDKMSKSKGNVMYADDLAKLFGVEAIRYYLLSQMPYASDGSISYEDIISVYNADLANTLGNLVNRSVTMVNKYFDGVLQNKNVVEDYDKELIDCCYETLKTFKQQMDQYHVLDALNAVMNLARRTNKYIDEAMPWVLAKDELSSDRLNTVMFNLIESIRYIAVMLQNFLPETAKEIFVQINSTEQGIDSLDTFGGGKIEKVGTASVMFGRIDEVKKLEEINAQLPKVEVKKEEPASEKPQGVIITIDDFAKVSLRVAQIKSCEKVPKSDRIYKLSVCLGDEQRQVVSGIAQWYSESDLVDKKVILVSNLAPAKLRGVESQGMLLAADIPNGDVKVLFVDESIPNGCKIR